MGQAWCKERTTKAQDSKSPLDRVFVRCAHQIYPTLKQDGSVLGGATQRVTSSEIGYAGSPPRDLLTRGRSVDSIDRPFHPSEWIDVNLEVPSTPRSSVVTEATANTNIYRTTMTMSSTGSNVRNLTPIPPPRRKRKNRGRPLPPKPDEPTTTIETPKTEKTTEPLYSPVKSQNERKSATKDSRGDGVPKDIGDREPKIEDTEKVTPTAGTAERREDPGDEPGRDARGRRKRNELGDETETSNENRRGDNDDDDKAEKKVKKDKANHRDSEYEKFSESHKLGVSTSTPIGAGTGNDKNKNKTERESSSGKDLRDFVSRTIMDEDYDAMGDDDDPAVAKQRHKNYSTVSLPNYDELEEVKKEVERESAENADAVDSTPKKPGRLRNVSTISLPADDNLEFISQKATERLENYMTRCRSFGSLQPRDIIDKINAQGGEIDSSDEDEWGGLDDWDLGVVEYNEPRDGRSPLVPSSQLAERQLKTEDKNFLTVLDKNEVVKNLKIDVTAAPDSARDEKSVDNEVESFARDERRLNIPRNSSFELPKSPNSLKSALKDEARRKISMPARLASEKSSSPLEEWFSAQERSVRFFDVPKLDEEYANTPGHRPAKPPGIVGKSKPDEEYDTSSYPFNGAALDRSDPIHIDKFFSVVEDFSGTQESGRESPSVDGRRKMLTRTLSNESEPFYGYEEKELTIEIPSQPSSASKLSRTISDESIPSEMESDSVDSSSLTEKRTGTGSRNSKTPPPSPEPATAKVSGKVVAAADEAKSAGDGGLLKAKGDEELEGESNLSSMTPSLTELEVALSDMLEKEDREDEKPDGEKSSQVRKRKENITISLGQILDDATKPQKSSSAANSRSGHDFARGKNPFEDSEDEEDDRGDSATRFDTFNSVDRGNASSNPFDVEPPEKPSRLGKIPLDDVPTPPQRRIKHGAVSPSQGAEKNHRNYCGRSVEYGNKDSVQHPDDRLI